MKQAGAKFIRTLTPSDFVAVYLNTPTVIRPTDTVNSDELIQFIRTQNFSMDATENQQLPIAAFELAFQQLENFAMEGLCHELIVLFSDSSLSQEVERGIRNIPRLNQDIDIFTYTFGGLAVDPTIPQSIACSYGGAWFGTGSVTLPSVDDVVPMYLTFYSAVLLPGGGGDAGVRWTESGSEGMMITGCVPVYQNTFPLLLGVTCIGLNTTRLHQLYEDAEEVRG